MKTYLRRHQSALFELLAFIAAAGLVGHLFGIWWALAPVAVYLFFLSWVLDRGKR